METLAGAILVSAVIAFAGAVAAGGLVRVLSGLGLVERPAGGHMRHWRRAADAAGLTGLEETMSTLSGSTEGLLVRFARYENDVAHGTRIVVSGCGLPRSLAIRSDPVAPRLVDRREIPTGDAAFDRIARVSGRHALALAVLDAEARRVLTGLMDGQLRQPGRPTFWASGFLESSQLQVDVAEVTPKAPAERLGWADQQAQGQMLESGQHAVAGLERLPEVLQRVLALARRLETPADVPGRVAENLANEPDPAVRERLLAMLVREASDLPVTREALLATRDDPDPRVRLLAGTALGVEGTSVLVHLADGEGADDPITQRAVSALGERLTPEQAVTVLHGALRTRRVETALACIARLRSHADANGIRLLQKVLAVEEPRLAVAAADALGELAPLEPALDEGRERALAAALDSEDVFVRRAAARTLGRVGSVEAVARLKQAEADDPPLRATARQAIALIQSRQPGAAPGQLSLAAAEAGQLSLADHDGGDLSLVGTASPPATRERSDAPPRRLSHPED